MIAGRTVAALRPNSWPLISVLSALMAFGPISTDLYVGTFPAIAEALETDVSAAQLTLTSFLLGVGVAQLFVGALSDRVGRRPVLIGGLLLFIGCAVACALATSITELVILRFFQAIGSCTPVVLSRAIVRDLHERTDSARVLGYVGGFMGMVSDFCPGAWRLLGVLVRLVGDVLVHGRLLCGHVLCGLAIHAGDPVTRTYRTHRSALRR